MAGGAALHANIFADAQGNDPRIVTPKRLFSPVGMVLTNVDRQTGARLAAPDGTPGSGFMVSPCHMLTNYHVVYGGRAGETAEGVALTVVLGAPARPFRGVVAAAGVFREPGDPRHQDWALLRLADCPGLQADIGWMDTAPLPARALLGKGLTTAGFPAGRGYRRLTVERGCRATAVYEIRAFMLSNCGSTIGSSGSPVMTFPGGKPVAVAFLSGEFTPTRGLSRYARDHSNATYIALLEAVWSAPGIAATIARDRAGRVNPYVYEALAD